MNVKREDTKGSRTQAERSRATREALLGAGRRLFGARGYAAVPAEAIVREAGVTRGALYHHFDGKAELLAAVYEELEREVVERVAGAVETPRSPAAALESGAQVFLDLCLEPEIQQIALLDAPAVLGWERWREIGGRYGLGLIAGLLEAAIDAGEIPPQPVEPLAHALLGALDEVAMLVARAEDPAATREQAGRTVGALIAALRASPP